ncbi:tyrosine-type recombinase/integrase [Rhodococcus koreensis]
MNALATSLQTYFTTFARAQRDLSSNTIASYRDTWRMLLKHLTATLDVPADGIDFDALTVANVTGFLDHLEHVRGNNAKTRNTRLTAIRAVLSLALPDHPEHAATITQVLAIPPKRTTRPVIEFLTPAEVDALLAAPDHQTRTGRRDHALLVMVVQTGLRISEVCALTVEDIHLGAGAHITCTGKGRRRRSTPLTRTTVHTMQNYLTERATRPGTALFCGPRGQALSRDALEHRLAKHLTSARTACPSLAAKHVTMHTLRHTAAMNLLAAGVDVAVIALWLGHADTHSTDAYLHADMTIKQAAIDRTRPPGVTPGSYHPEPDILAWLTAL